MQFARVGLTKHCVNPNSQRLIAAYLDAAEHTGDKGVPLLTLTDYATDTSLRLERRLVNLFVDDVVVASPRSKPVRKGCL